MRLRTGPQKMFEVLVRAFKAMMTHERLPNDPGDPPTEETLKEHQEMMRKIIARAEERSGLDLGQDVDREVFILAAATVLYSPNDRGAQIKWNEASLKRLVADVEALRAQAKKKISDQECCEQLLKQSPYKNMVFQDQKKAATAIRRQLTRGRKFMQSAAPSAKI
jgi:hypothetical protein